MNSCPWVAPACVQVWRDHILDFMKEFVDTPAVLVGNSLGSLACLMVRPHLLLSPASLARLQSALHRTGERKMRLTARSLSGAVASASAWYCKCSCT